MDEDGRISVSTVIFITVFFGACLPPLVKQ